MSWTNDVKPWLSGEIGVAVTSAAFDVASMSGLGADGLDGLALEKAPADGAVVLIAVKDANAAKSWVAQQIGGSQVTETYAGGEITLVTDTSSRSLAFAVRDSVLHPWAGGRRQGCARHEWARARSGRASRSPPHARPRRPPTSVYGYMDVQAFVDAAIGAAGDQADVPAACLDAAIAMVPAWAAGSARAIDDAIVFEATSPVADDGAATESGSASTIASHLPASTVAASRSATSDPASRRARHAQEAARLRSLDGRRRREEIDQVLAAVGGAEVLVGWAGDTAIALDVRGRQRGGWRWPRPSTTRMPPGVRSTSCRRSSPSAAPAAASRRARRPTAPEPCSSWRSPSGDRRRRDPGARRDPAGRRVRPRYARLRQADGRHVRPARLSPRRTRTSVPSALPAVKA